MSFYDILVRNNASLGFKIKKFKSRKIHIFPKRLTHGSGPKMAIFPTFFFGDIGQENVFYDILERKNAFLGYKTRSSKSGKIDIFPKGLTNGLGTKITIFRNFLFTQYRPEKHLSRYSRT